ncbi:GH36-type glycosyl hydrolase domain-containing protein [Methanoplanus endosymbiosus]|uniref:Cyclic beta 1-2 glucan synthetase n=1 Tax=Methanoplanus endosymbiosus TaxID=33865 RepID=A0A9E7TLC5_9EURY|nr:glucoamylase family protein [Methanoplanus endosymbiosus]UUX93689.1 cyclic beta 1-2 glucan synthetase [Methanoplanus endosymbiosus]
MRNKFGFKGRFNDKEASVSQVDAGPLRDELYSRDQMVQHAKEIAGIYRAGPGNGYGSLLPRLADNEKVLLDTYNLLNAANEASRRIAPAGEWLLDNFYLIDEQILTARCHLSEEYCEEFPRLENGPFEGFPRIYHIATELIAHSDGRIDDKTLLDFINSYQSVTPLLLGELWAVPIMLRLSLIENLRRISGKISADRLDCDSADQWVDQMTEVAGHNPKGLIPFIADMARSDLPMTSAFVAEMARQLQGQSGSFAFPLTWIEQRLSESNLTIEQMVNAEAQAQAVDQVSFGNCINSLRLLDLIDWREFVEKVSLVEHILRSDPADNYAAMDFETRDRYRHVVEEIAKKGRLGEGDVAGKAVELACDNRNNKDGEIRASHVGYYLTDEGRVSLEEALSYTPPFSDRFRRKVYSFTLPLYFSGILSLILIAALFGYGHIPAYAWYITLPVMLLLLFPVSQVAVAVINWVYTILIPPVLLPKMDYSSGIPDDQRTIVVIPTVLSEPGDVASLLDSLEVRYLANRDDNLHFALLTDLRNASVQELPGDEELVSLLAAGIEGLNSRYCDDKPSTFFLMHRARTWNESEGVWMGYERKRGILGAFNTFILGRGTKSFSRIVGDQEILGSIRYVITLDTDTELPRSSAGKLIGTLAHPLNRPVMDPVNQVIREGYGILQPRVALSLRETGISRFASFFGGEPGIDPYTRAVSDLYQDAFKEGSFIGKGIYDLEVFSQIFEGRFPENLILSHDLLEGCYARAGFVSDVLVLEDYPNSYLADIKRRHRWIRGDWQIMQWIFPFILDASSKVQRNPLSLLCRWKIFDNLRRSLVAPAALLFLIMSWISFGNPLFWTAFIASLYLIPSVIIICRGVVKKPEKQTWMLHLRDLPSLVRSQITVPLINLIFLPYEAYISLDAMLRSCFRMAGSHRHLLEWTTNQEAAQAKTSGLAGMYRIMWAGPVIGAGLLALQIQERLVSSPVIAFFACAWILSPIIASWISQPQRSHVFDLTPDQSLFLRAVARKTWRFFETFVTAEDHYLPPDNYQEQPVSAVAHRTSPTDVGLLLLANLTAYDFGYLSLRGLIERTGNTMNTMGQLKRFRGHFYNWYDTITLKPLLPRYISTVDSGNLVSHLLVLRQGLCELPDTKIMSDKFADGLSDTLSLLSEALDNAQKEGGAESFTYGRSKIAELKDGAARMPVMTGETLRSLSSLDVIASEVRDALGSHPDDDVRWWAGAVKRQTEAHIKDLNYFVLWQSTGSPPDTVWREIPEHLTPYVSLICTTIEGLDNQIPTIGEIAEIRHSLYDHIGPLREWLENPSDSDSFFGLGRMWLIRTIDEMEKSVGRAEEVLLSISRLSVQCRKFSEIEYEFLYDRASNLLAIGYNATDLRRDASFYDLLASEARTASFVGIAYGKLPQDHWFALGRLLTNIDGGKPTLISWSGSMFEYLMPLLVMPTYENTLLDRTYHAVVARQIDYSRRRGIPWGISESGYNVTDTSLNYQYRAFGIPGLGFKRGLADDLVIAPYAAVMGLMVNPFLACRNLEKMSSSGYCGEYGFYEAIDFTRSRTPPGQKYSIIQSFMAHHQGMALLSLAYVILDRPMQRRFMSDLSLQSAAMLLQEKMPLNLPFYPHTGEVEGVHKATDISESLTRTFNSAKTPRPEVHLLSNGRYHVMVNNSGSGYSRWNDLAVTRWREDPTADCSGTFCYIRDLASGEFWSNGYQPTKKKPVSFQTTFRQAQAEFLRKDWDFYTRTEVIVSPEDDVELRRVWVTNRSWNPRSLEFTSYAEVVLAPQASDESHPAFTNLFVQTELIPERNAILATRRPRSEGERPPWMFHLMTVNGKQVRKISFETDRLKFIGRGNSLAQPVAMIDSSTLSDTAGSVLDPVVAIRCTISIEPQETGCVNIFSGVCESRDDALAMIEKYYDRNITDRVLEMAWTHAQVMLRQLDATEQDAQIYSSLASSVIYSNPVRRASGKVLIKNKLGQSGLWRYGISGDVPIVLVRIKNRKRISIIRDMVQAHAYWHMKGLMVDLVICNEERSGYRQELQDEILSHVPQGSDSQLLNKKGGIFILNLELMSDEDFILLQTVARAVISDRAGSLAEQMERAGWCEVEVPQLLTTRTPSHDSSGISGSPGEGLLYFNGIGGFSPDGKEYVIITDKWNVTPAPWVNILANENFGTVVSENGSAYTWCENSHEFRLTPWMNDPVQDLSGEGLYIRDEETGKFWSPGAWPVRGAGSYVTRHGFGYSVFEYSEQGISSELTVYVSVDSPVKFLSLKLRNRSGRKRFLSVTGYVEWVLGELRSKSLPYVVTEIDQVSGAVFAKNPYNCEFPGRVAFFDSNIINRTLTGDRHEFIGRNGSADRPAAMERVRLSNKVGAGLDPCAAVQVHCELTDGEEREIIFTLGVGRDGDDARTLLLKNRGVEPAHAALKAVKDYWGRTLGAVQVKTPDMSVDLLANGWLVYQIIASRLWARSGFYQSGGAFGFRDQLQDVMALIHTRPELMRRQLLLCAGHQFIEGDAQHWWHPPLNRGVRTHCSDDYLWLPFAASRYVLSTRDFAVLDEEILFIEGRELLPEEDSYYDLPNQSETSASLYEHCVLAVRRGMRFGEHGLPLMGTGDWNDGMNLVGAGGKGESVWLGFFIFDLLMRFSKVAEIRGDLSFAEFCRVNAEQLRVNIERYGWDGEWYRRAYFDSGEPLGSAVNKECMIDSIAQSWAVLSGAASEERAVTAMEAVKEHLILREDRLLPLLIPPFDKTMKNPGYIKGYVPGVRENGGQYSHAAIWVVAAFAVLKDNEQAWDLLPFINPIHHSRKEEDVRKYRVEPYALASDIYAAAPHTGRGGWTWYSGSAGYMYTLILESLLGVRLSGDCLTFDPCIPADWDSYQVDYRYLSAMYHIVVKNSGKEDKAPGKISGESSGEGSGTGGGSKSCIRSVIVDGVNQADKIIHLADDQEEHRVVVELGD